MFFEKDFIILSKEEGVYPESGYLKLFIEEPEERRIPELWEFYQEESEEQKQLKEVSLKIDFVICEHFKDDDFDCYMETFKFINYTKEKRNWL